MDLLRNGWFTEFSPDDAEHFRTDTDGSLERPNIDENTTKPDLWSGQAFSLHVKEVLFSERSKYQDIMVLKSHSYGNVLVLDGVIQTTDRDEFAYQEMLTHLPMFSHPNPRQILIIGGGDGGILREVLKHPSVEKVTMCEIDGMVVDVAKKFLPQLSVCFASPKLTLHIGDGFEFLKAHKQEFDVVITDSSDPFGPAESLFGKPYYELISESLCDGGILASQAESIWLHFDLITSLVHSVRQIFKSIAYASSTVPSYPSGSIGYLLASKKQCDLTTPARELLDLDCQRWKLRYYNSQVHRSAFVLPNFAKICFH